MKEWSLENGLLRTGVKSLLRLTVRLVLRKLVSVRMVGVVAGRKLM